MGVRGICVSGSVRPGPGAVRRARWPAFAPRSTRSAATTSALVSVGRVSARALLRVRRAVRRRPRSSRARKGCPLAVHIAESEDESSLVQHALGGSGRDIAPVARHRGRAARRLAHSPAGADWRARRHARCSSTAFASNGDDIRRMARHDCASRPLPGVEREAGARDRAAHAISRGGIRVGLGSDSVASNNRMDLLDEARLAILMQRARNGSHDVVCAAGGARARDVRRRARPRLWSARSARSTSASRPTSPRSRSLTPRSAPVYDPATALVFAASGHAATFVAVAGRPLVARRHASSARRRRSVALGRDPAAARPRCWSASWRRSRAA